MSLCMSSKKLTKHDLQPPPPPLKFADSNTRCSLCSHPYDLEDNFPKSLDCFHTFCLKCIAPLITQVSDTISVISCPTCRQEMDVPPVGLSPNYALLDLKKPSSEGLKLVLCSVCDESEKPHSAGYVCVDCGDQLMCETARKWHLKMAVSKGHRILPIRESDSKDLYFQQSICHNHHQLLDQFCFECQIPICTQCLISDTHSEHQTEKLKKIYEEEKNDVMPLLDGMEKKAREMELAGIKLLRIREAVREDKVNVEQDINNFFDQAETSLRLRRQLLLDEVQKLSVNKENSLTIHYEDLTHTASSLQSAIAQIREVVKRNSEEKFMGLKTQLGHFLQSLPSRKIGLETPIQADLSFQYDPQVLELLYSLGSAIETSESSVSAEHSSAEGRGLEYAFPGKSSEFSIIARDRSDRKREIGGDNFLVEFKGEYKVPATIRDNKNGTYSVAYTLPEDANGEFRIFIFLYGAQIRGSPFILKVAKPGTRGWVLDSYRKGNKVVLLNGNLTLSGTGTSFQPVFGSQGFCEGIHTWEVIVTRSGGTGHVRLGLATTLVDLDHYLGSDSEGFAYHEGGILQGGANLIEGRKTNSSLVLPGVKWKIGDKVGFLLSLQSKERPFFSIFVNGEKADTQFLQPPTETRPYFPAFCVYHGSITLTKESYEYSSVG